MLEIRNLTHSFGKKTVLDNVSFSFEPGVYGLLGPNGAGKTTLMRCMARIYAVQSGAIAYDGKEIEKRKDYLRHIGYLPQKFGMFRDLTVYETMDLLAHIKGIHGKGLEKEITECIEQVNLGDRINNKVRTLSGGMLRRLGIAQSLLGNPEIIILDEPTAGLDPEERLRFKLLVSEIQHDRTIIISTHIVNDIDAVCDKIIVLSEGKIAASGSCNDIRMMGNGRVYVLPQEELAGIYTKYYVQEQYEFEERKMIRIISPEMLPYSQVEPTLDDGYICIQKGL